LARDTRMNILTRYSSDGIADLPSISSIAACVAWSNPKSSSESSSSMRRRFPARRLLESGLKTSSSSSSSSDSA
jgi:hypothetical protein